MAVIQPRSTYITYQCTKFGDDRALFNVIFDVMTFNMLKAYTHILVFYFSAIMIDIDIIFIQDTYWGHNKIYQIIWPLYVKGQGHSEK